MEWKKSYERVARIDKKMKVKEVTKTFIEQGGSYISTSDLGMTKEWFTRILIRSLLANRGAKKRR